MALPRKISRGGNTSFAKYRRLGQAEANKFEVITGGWEYRAREDITTLPPNIMIKGSQNVVTDVSGWVASRKGYTLDGQKNTGNYPVLGTYDWQTHFGPIRHTRSWNTTMDVRYVNPSGVVSWVPIFTALQSPKTNFTPFWNNTTQQDYLLWVDGSSQIYEWSGGLAALNSVSNASGVISNLSGTPTVGGSGYVIGDIVNITGGGGSGAQATVLHTTNGAISTLGALDNAGTGYTANDIITVGNAFTGTATGATIKVLTIGGGGSIATFSIVTGGANYTATHNWPVTGGTGTGALINITAVVNGYVGTTDGSPAIALSASGTGYSTGTGTATSGGTGTGLTVNIVATASNSITIQGTTPATEQGFYNDASNHQLIINGNTFTYTNVTGMVFAGINVDPTTFGLTSGMAVAQGPIVKLNTSFTSGPGVLYNNDLIGNLGNRICLGSLTNNIIFFSKTNDYTDYSTHTPMVVGDGVQVITDSPPTGFVTQETTIYISAGSTQWYQVTFEVSADLTKESLKIQPVNTSGLQAAQSQAFITKVKNTIGFLSFEPIFNTLGRVPNIFADQAPQFSDLSNPIINDMTTYNFTDGSAKFCTNYIYLAVPKQSIVRIYNMTDPKRQYWEAPQTLPFSRFSVIDGQIYGHSYLVNETYKLFDGRTDNGNQISANATLAYFSNGMRATLKNFNEFYTEGYISSNTTLTQSLMFNLNGSPNTYSIKGNDTSIVESSANDNSFGKFPFGKQPFGGDLAQASSIPPKFRVIKTFPRVPYFEYSVSYSSQGLNQDWRLLAQGAAWSPSTEQAISIKQ